ncbi:MAG: hypothetical protein WD226_12455 [Planctomycetota bacterium]
MLRPLLLALATSSFVAAPSAQSTGWPALGTDPTTAGLFGELAVRDGEPARTIARNVQGTLDGRPFVNVVRWTDARRFRGRLLAVHQRARLDAPTPGTTAHLWVRVLRSGGGVGFQDAGLDRATSSTEWTPLESVGAVAADATDLVFGLFVEGTTPVHLGEFELEVRGPAAPDDLRFHVPARWIRDADVANARVSDHARGLDLRVTTFTPPGHAAGSLPALWLVRPSADLAATYAAGRALVDAMRTGREPAAALVFVEPVSGVLATDSVVRDAFATHLVPAFGAAQPPLHVVAHLADARIPESLAGSVEPAAATHDDEAAARYRAHLAASDPWRAERVHLRWARAQHEAAASGGLVPAALLFDAEIEALEPWQATALVRHASHSLSGHDCGHDHSHDHSHDHAHPHATDE